MSTCIEDIREYLDIKEVKYLYDPEKEVFILSFAPNVILVRLEENGEFLQFRTLNFFQYKEGKNKLAILELLASMNYQRKLVKFGYDSEDGEINACIDIPIEDATFTSTQFFRCMAALLEALEEGRNRTTVLMETGEDPGPSNSKVIDTLVEEIMESLDSMPEDNDIAVDDEMVEDLEDLGELGGLAEMTDIESEIVDNINEPYEEDDDDMEI